MSSYVDTVLNAVYSGEKLLISFSTSSERERFRQTLYRQKKRQDSLLSAISEEKRKTLKFLPLLSADAAAENRFQARVFLEDRAFFFEASFLVESSSTTGAEKNQNDGDRSASGS